MEPPMAASVSRYGAVKSANLQIQQTHYKAYNHS